MFDSTHFHSGHHLAFDLSTNVHTGIGWSSSLGSAFAILTPHLWVQHWAIRGRGSYSVVSIDVAPMFRHVTPQVCWDWCFCWLGWGNISITNILTFGGHTSLWTIITWIFFSHFFNRYILLMYISHVVAVPSSDNLDVTIFSPVSTPWVLDQPVILAIFTSVSYH